MKNKNEIYRIYIAVCSLLRIYLQSYVTHESAKNSHSKISNLIKALLLRRSKAFSVNCKKETKKPLIAQTSACANL
ncbi:MAG: hypothetical protein COX07_00530 [Bacteroidetes bacterium CG23_combo_of_CG06-09_8_20_14_all_32_9]|nr:MAG: hypothetical protein COX07_00530 [Bacteroidetes bacterium CG23_combo_of_CG06-09_8_20_14_all_32_9]